LSEAPRPARELPSWPELVRRGGILMQAGAHGRGLARAVLTVLAVLQRA
jgi:hypothetical protein